MSQSGSLCPILVAEDNANDLFLFRRCLQKAGIRHPVVALANGEEVISFLRAACVAGTATTALHPRLLFLDIKMPRADGFDVLRWIRGQKALRDLTVIMLSGAELPDEVRRAKELGAARFLLKYPPPKVFAGIVAEVLGP